MFGDFSLLDHWLVISIALGYLLLLFIIAEFGERHLKTEKSRPWIYSLSLAVYCTSWAMYGTVAQSQSTGWYIAPTYLGSILTFIFAWPLLLRIIKIAKNNKVTSIADFIAARFGRSNVVGGLVVIICLIAVIPYIALQLKAMVNSFALIAPDFSTEKAQTEQLHIWQDAAFYVALMLAFFTILFGTRRVDATENHQGVMLAIAFESIIKLTAFFLVGIFSVYFIFDGFENLWQSALKSDITRHIIEEKQPSFIYLSQVFLGFIAIICLPRQFHVLVVENRSTRELMISRWIFPGYLMLINFFILPIALVGTLYFQGSSVSAEEFVLMLPASENNPLLALLVFIGGISAATGMIIVATIVLSTMISNEIIVPLAVKFFSKRLSYQQNLGQHLLGTRRLLIGIILLLAYLFYRSIAVNEQLSTTGLLSMALIAQLAPSLIGGIYWHRCSRKASVISLLVGLLLWCYTLLIPFLVSAGVFSDSIINNGPFSIALLKPTELFGLFGFDLITHGLMWSLGANCLALFYFSIKTETSLTEKMQAEQFLSIESDPDRVSTHQDSILKANDLALLAARFLGRDEAKAAFKQFCQQQNIDGIHQAEMKKLTAYTQQLLQAIIGATSTRLVFESLENNPQVPFQNVANIIDEASDVLLFNRELLQSAIENVSHGISVVDKDLRLVAWNNQYVKLFNYPEAMVEVGRPIEDLCRFNAKRGFMGDGNIDLAVNKRLNFMREGSPHVYERQRNDGLVLEMRGNPMPGGGFVTSFIDITEFRRQQTELEQINKELEQRVSLRTSELEQLNQRLLEAKAMAESANHSKTRFLAAASHDVLQPLNVASLFSATLHEQVIDEHQKGLTLRIQQALHSAEHLLKDLIEISKLDSGNIAANIQEFSLAELMQQLHHEFSALANNKNIHLSTVFCHKLVKTDRTMLRRVLQNFLSNAVKHANTKKILFGCRRQGKQLYIQIIDQGDGIPQEKQQQIFQEFVQLKADEIAVEGHGLGLAIVNRILKITELPLILKSVIGRGCCFGIKVPLAQTQTITSKPELSINDLVKPNKLLGLQVICIDNEPDILDGMYALLTSWGYKDIICSLDGDLSQQQGFNAENIGLILADYHLEDNKTGVQAINQLRAEATWDVPSVVISADQSEQLKAEVRENELFLLNKPLKPLALRALLNRLIK